MNFLELVLLGAALAMDAFAVSVSKGLTMIDNDRYKNAIVIALFFGGFQALMPLIGYYGGSAFMNAIEAYDHWVAFILLAFIGARSIQETIRDAGKDKASVDDSGNGTSEAFELRLSDLTMLAFATSIDALAVGISFAAMENVNVAFSVSVIGIVTFIISMIGVLIGKRIGTRYERKARIAGGLILIAIGVRILLVGLGVYA